MNKMLASVSRVKLKLPYFITNWLKLSSANVLTMAVSLGTLFITVHAMGVVDFGRISLAQSYVRLFQGLFAFQTAAALVRFGAGCVGSEEKEEIARLIRICLSLDLITGVVGAVTAGLVILLFGSSIGFDHQSILWVMVGLTALPTNALGTCSGVFQILHRYSLGAVQQVIIAICRLIGVGILWAYAAHPTAFVFMNVGVDIAGNLLAVFLARRELCHLSIFGFGFLARIVDWRSTAIWRGFWSTMWSANLQVALRLSTAQVDVLIVGAVLGSEQAAYLRLAKGATSVVSQMGWPLNTVVAPALTTKWLNQDIRGFSRILLKSAASGVVFFVCCLILFGIFGHTIIVGMFGQRYAGATQIVVTLSLVSAVMVIGAPILPTLYAMNKAVAYLWIHVLGAAVFYLILWLAIKWLGLLSVSAAHAAYILVWIVTGYTIVLMELHRARRA